MISEIASTDNIDSVISKWLDDVINNSPKAIQYGLEAFDKVNSSESNHKFLSQMLELVLSSDDAREGVAAFKEKRNPNWK